ncbi:MAG TPA: hypothetical protein PLD88_10995 [Candidatus Berkiella sp.]|nr:hypothetical protein [Candidatus Berkiella sp.]
MPELAYKLGKAIVSGGSKVLDAAKSRWTKKPEVKATQEGTDSLNTSLASHLMAKTVVQNEITTGKSLLSAFNLSSTAVAQSAKAEPTLDNKAKNTARIKVIA